MFTQSGIADTIPPLRGDGESESELEQVKLITETETADGSQPLQNDSTSFEDEESTVTFKYLTKNTRKRE